MINNSFARTICQASEWPQWGMRTRSRRQGRAPAVGSVKGPSRGRGATDETRRLRPFAGLRSNRWSRPLADGRQDPLRPPALRRSATRCGEVGGAGAAHAGRGDRNVRLLQGRGKLEPQGGKLPGLTAPLQAFDEAVQGPDIIGVLRAKPK